MPVGVQTMNASNPVCVGLLETLSTFNGEFTERFGKAFILYNKAE
jgi:hypothetical protein